MNSYWIPHASSENHCETTESLKICYLFNINQEKIYRTKITDVDELKWRINSEWALWVTRSLKCCWRAASESTRFRSCGGHFEHTL